MVIRFSQLELFYEFTKKKKTIIMQKMGWRMHIITMAWGGTFKYMK